MKTWISDDKGNRCSVEYWGSKEKARAALATLSNCSRCIDCLRCSDCTDCTGCMRCTDYAGWDFHKTSPSNKPPTPRIDDIHAKMYSAVSRPGALALGTWHTCETTHCRAGWVVELAGEAGKALEAFYNTELAAMLIYEASGYNISPRRFYDSDAAALSDMKRLAGVE